MKEDNYYSELANNLTDEVVDLRIENERLNKENKHLKEQLTVKPSSTLLPTKEERDLELSKRVEDIKQHSSMGANKQMVLAYRIGFEEYDDWLRKR